MEGLIKIQNLIEEQKEIKTSILNIFSNFYVNQLNNNSLPKIEVEFVKQDLIRVKIKETSSMKFVILKNKETLLNLIKSVSPDKTFLLN